MNKFKKIIMSGHTQKKEYLHKLYTDRQVYISSVRSSAQPVEDEKVFCYRDVYFRFEGTGYRTMEKMVILVYVPKDMIDYEERYKEYITAYEDYLLRMISKPINKLSDKYKNDKKSTREKPEFSVQNVNSVVQRRNGCIFMEEEESFRIRVHFTAPLINGTNLNGKSTFKAVRDIMEIICDRLNGLDKVKLQEHILLYKHQTEIRGFLRENDYVAFVGNGSILPRMGETDEPMENAILFSAPKEREISIELSDGNIVTGMGIRKGITVITGGGYSGKSTLLDGLEMGIYNHIKGDGREYVLADETACKIYAEDGRYIENTNISPFFSYMPGNVSVNCFSTKRASGSVSQAASIIEAVYGKTKVLLIDEDTSATNFMIRDNNMRLLVQNEPIIPFTDRIEEIKGMGISTILVIGGSSEYLKYADTVILMEDYLAKDRTEYVKEIIKPKILISNKENDVLNSIQVNDAEYSWMREKNFVTENKSEFFYSECVQIENARYIKIDDYVADITKITSIISDEQINSLTYLLEKILSADDGVTDLLEKCSNVVKGLFDGTKNTTLSNSHKYELWLSDVRVVDLLMTVCRMRR